MYTFSSRPKPVENRFRYKEPPTEQNQRINGNIIYDRRVARGSTYSRSVIPNVPLADPVGSQRLRVLRKRSTARKKEGEQLKSTSPEPVEESYLEELGKITPIKDTDCQTDEFMDKPATPLFIPAKSGVDVATQIEEGELFYFDREVQPILEVLVGKTIEQSLLEVMEEEELAFLRAQQKVFEEIRNCEMAEVQRLEEQERRRTEEKKHRMAQQKAVLQKEKETAEKIAARLYTQQFMSDFQLKVFKSLKDQGYLFDPLEEDIETNFFPWLMVEVDNCLEKRCAARELLDNIILEVTQKRLELLKDL